MTRKRGKSRLSSADKRAYRYRRKYVVDTLTKRPKKLLPVMYPQMRDALIDWDYLETLLFPVFEALGIDVDQYPYYMAWAKRKGEAGLRFSSVTQAEEWAILQDEFEARGLNPAFLVEIEPYVEYWVHLLKGEPSNIVDLKVNSVVYLNWWNPVGASPYLDTDDGDTSKIYQNVTWSDGQFGFEDTTRDGAPVKIELHVKVKKEGAANGVLGIVVTGGVGAWSPNPLTISQTAYTERVITTASDGTLLKDYLNTKTKINSAKINFLLDGNPYPTYVHITYCYLKVFY